MHGAGSAKREREGRRKNPKLAPVKHGFRAERDTVGLLLNVEPDLAAEYRRQLNEAGYTGVREERALAEALLHWFLCHADLHDPDTLDAALKGTVRVALLKQRQDRVEREAGMTSAEDLVTFLKALGRAVRRYVPEGDRQAFYATVREQSGVRPLA